MKGKKLTKKKNTKAIASSNPLEQGQELIALGSSRTSRVAPSAVKNKSDLRTKSDENSSKEKSFEKLNEELVYSVLKIWYDVEGDEKFSLIEKKILSAFEELINNNGSSGGLSGTNVEVNKSLFSSLAYLGVLLPDLFTHKPIFSYMNTLLSTDPKQKQFNKAEDRIPVLCCGLFYNAYKNRPDWPLSFFQSYIEDAFNSRVWVQSEYAKLFILNILTALPDSFVAICNRTSENYNMAYHSASIASGLTLSEEEQPLVVNRWSQNEKDKVKKFVLDMLKYQVQQNQESNRSFIKVLYTTASIPESRAMGSNYFEEWISNTSISRYQPWKEYLQRVVSECHDVTSDISTLTNILKLKVKSVHQQLYFDLITQVLKNNKEFYPHIALRYFLIFEMLSKGQPNLKLLSLITKASENLEGSLAKIVLEMLLSDEYRNSIIPLFKKLFKLISKELDIERFIRNLIDFVTEHTGNMTEAVLSTVVDLLCFLQISSLEVTKDLSIKEKLSYQIKISKIQHFLALWLQRHLSNIINSLNIFIQTIKRLYFFEPLANYANIFELNDKKYMYNILTNEIPLLEDTVTVFILLAIYKPNLPSKDAIEFIERLVIRAANLYIKLQNNNIPIDQPILLIIHPEFIEPLISLSIYKPRTTPELENEAKNFVVSNWYWQICMILLIIATFNPSTIGRFVWENFCTLKVLMEICVTRRFTYNNIPDVVPPAELEQEKLAIISLESKLAQKVVTEGTSTLLNQIMRTPIPGYTKKAPIPFLETLQKLEKDLQLGKELCSCRSPDFLISIMSTQGTMDWLLPIVNNDSSTLPVLPISVLCHLFVANIDLAILNKSSHQYPSNITTPQELDLIKILMQIEKWLNHPTDATPASEIILFFSNQLSSQSQLQRRNAKIALSMIFFTSSSSLSEKDEVAIKERFSVILNSHHKEWKKLDVDNYSHIWLNNIIHTKYFKVWEKHVYTMLLNSVTVEDNTKVIYNYISFIHSTEYWNTSESFREQVAFTISVIIRDRYLIFEQSEAEDLLPLLLICLSRVFQDALQNYSAPITAPSLSKGDINALIDNPTSKPTLPSLSDLSFSNEDLPTPNLAPPNLSSPSINIKIENSNGSNKSNNSKEGINNNNNGQQMIKLFLPSGQEISFYKVIVGSLIKLLTYSLRGFEKETDNSLNNTILMIFNENNFKNPAFINIIDVKQAIDLSRSKNETLIKFGLSRLSELDLLHMLSEFGQSLRAETLIIQQLLLSPNLMNIYQSLTPDVKSSIIENLKCYEDLGVMETSLFFKHLNIPFKQSAPGANGMGSNLPNLLELHFQVSFIKEINDHSDHNSQTSTVFDLLNLETHRAYILQNLERILDETFLGSNASNCDIQSTLEKNGVPITASGLSLIDLIIYLLTPNSTHHIAESDIIMRDSSTKLADYMIKALKSSSLLHSPLLRSSEFFSSLVKIIKCASSAWNITSHPSLHDMLRSMAEHLPTIADMIESNANTNDTSSPNTECTSNAQFLRSLTRNTIHRCLGDEDSKSVNRNKQSTMIDSEEIFKSITTNSINVSTSQNFNQKVTSFMFGNELSLCERNNDRLIDNSAIFSSQHRVFELLNSVVIKSTNPLLFEQCLSYLSHIIPNLLFNTLTTYTHHFPPPFRCILYDWINMLFNSKVIEEQHKYQWIFSSYVDASAANGNDDDDDDDVDDGNDQKVDHTPLIANSLTHYYSHYLLPSSILLHSSSWISLRKISTHLLAEYERYFSSHLFSRVLNATSAHSSSSSSIEILKKNIKNNKEGSIGGYNESAILDFFSAYLSHPRSWRGYVAVPEHTIASYQHSHLLTFSPLQLCQIVKLILLESLHLLNRTPHHNHHHNKREEGNMQFIDDDDDDDDGDDDRRIAALIDRRLPLLLSILHQNATNNVHTLLLYLTQEYSSLSHHSQTIQSLIEQLQLQVYLLFPNESIDFLNTSTSSFLQTDNTFLQLQNARSLNLSSPLDKQLHRLIKLLSDPNFNAVAYKLLSNLAVQHKRIILKYVPFISALLQGRAHVSAQTFRDRNYQMIFLYCLELIDLLRPEVFDSSSLLPIIECYVDLALHSNQQNNLILFIGKLASFLCCYSLSGFASNLVAMRPSLITIAKTFSDFNQFEVLLTLLDDDQHHSNMLSDHTLRSDDDVIYSNSADQQCFVESSRLALRRWLKTHSLDISKVQVPNLFSDSTSSLADIHQFPPQSLISESSFSDIPPSSSSTLLSSSKDSLFVNDDYLMEVETAIKDTKNMLEELEKLSAQRPLLLQHFIDDLLLLIRAPFPSLRSLAYLLLLRLIQYAPETAMTIVPCFLICFSHPDEGIKLDALKYSSEFYYSHDQSAELLNKLFNMGIPAGLELRKILQRNYN